MANNPYDRDWDDLGRNIQDLIDRAVNSQNYQKLNQAITQVVKEAVGTGTEAVRRAREQSEYTRQNGTWKSSRDVQGKVVYTYHPPKQPPVKNQPQNNLPVLYSSPTGRTAGGIAKTIGGSLVASGSALGLVVSAAVRLLVTGGALLSIPMAAMGAGLVGGVVLLGNGISNLSRMSRYKVYLKTLGQKTYCDLEQLARSVGKNTKFVRKDLQGMINDGLFLEGHLDADNRSLITSNETYQLYEQSRQQQEEQKRRQQQEELLRIKKEPQDARVQEVLDRGHAFIAQIRKCNDDIPGEEISRKISRMEMIVQKIFDRAEEHPEIVPDLKKLMDYYLPMTIKLLNAYADMDHQPIQGETIQNSKREIEATLDTLNNAFEKLLDSVFKDTAMDVSSDISVLQSLLAQEGLTDDPIAGGSKPFNK